ncbi:hypothetical protein OAA64_01495 [bacterium]|mgnify:CR=1 FL=1|nr:hypothetical protein [bacterium]
MIKTEQLHNVTPELITFIDECNNLGYKNNNSLEAMKFQWCLDEGGAWFATSVDNRIVGISGLHKFKDGHRALFRGCQLYSIPGGLSKNHMNCWMFYYHLPLVGEIIDGPVYITTNTDTDASGKMLKLNKLYSILEKKGIVDFISKEEVFYVEQNIWKLNLETYFKLRPEKQ